MIDLRVDDAAFEQELRGVLADLAPNAAPGSLRSAVASVPARTGRRSPVRALLAAAALAAAVILVVGSIGLVGGPRPVLPGTGRPASGDVPTAVPSPSPATVRLTFDVVTADGSMATKEQVDAVESVMDARLHAYGVGTFSSSAGDDRITYEVLLPQGEATTVDALREVLKTTGAFSISLLGTDPVDVGTHVTTPPLVTGDAVIDARTGVDQSGTPTLDLTFDATGASAIADATRSHVGEYLGIALDGDAIVVPVINSEILDGRMQLSFATDDTTPARLAPILQSGPLPLPVEAVMP